MIELRKAMSDIIRNYVGAQGTPEERVGHKQMNLLEFDVLVTGALHAPQLAAGCAV